MQDLSATGTVVWQRQFDPSASTRRWRKFRLWCLLPLVVGLALALVLGGVGAFLGVLILFGAIFGLVALLLWLYDKSLQQNAEIHLVDGKLVLGRTEVTVAQIESWTTHRRSGPSGDIPGPAAQVMFRVPVYRDGTRGVRPDGGAAFETAQFGWGEMPGDELAGVRRALELHIDAPWVPLDRLRD